MRTADGMRLPDGTVVVHGDAQHMNKMRCMACQAEAIEYTRPDSKKVFKCTSCGREWVASKF